jgi:glycosyltransferase involved in cell wall biosynthesis
VLFFASPVHAPNRDALAWVATEILPALRRLRPSARVVCAGFPCGLPEARAAAAAGAEMPGFVPDLRRELARAAVVLSPLRAGGGVRIKNVETLLEGAPLVTTPRGAEGLGAGSGEAWLVAEDAAGLARACAGLLADPPRAEALGARGRELAIARFDAATRTDHLLRIWAALASRAPRAGRAP